jgi:hypothetical protein
MFKRRQIRQSVLLSVFVGAVLLFSQTHSLVKAQTPATDEQQLPPLAIQVIPTTQKLDLTPGASISGMVKVANVGTQPFSYEVYASPYQMTDEQYRQPDYERETTRTQISRWITFERTSGELSSLETDTIAYTINVPANVPAGGQYAVIFAETQTLENAGGGVQIKRRVGTLVYGHLAGETQETGELIGHKLKRWWWQPPVTLYTTVANSGNTDFEVTATTKATSIFGKLYPSEHKNYTILPETRREEPFTIPDLPALGIYKISQSLTFLQEQAEFERWVFVVPLWALILIIGLIVLISAFLIYRRWRKKQQHRPRMRELIVFTEELEPIRSSSKKTIDAKPAKTKRQRRRVNKK